MAPLSASDLLIGSTSLANLSSSRHHPPSLAVQREEGWTEVWGGKGNVNKDNDGDDTATKTIEIPYLPPRYVTVMKDGNDYIDGRRKSVNATDSTTSKVPNQGTGGPSSIMMKLSQHRVAWLEQIVLRMNYIPHVVENSGYAARESTGGLPHLLDLPLGNKQNEHGGDGNRNNDDAQDPNDDDVWGNAWKKSLSRLNKPVLIGRNQPGGLGSNFFHQHHEESKSSSSTDFNPSLFLPSGSHIVDYLRLKHSHRMNENLLFPEHLQEEGQSSGDAMAYESLIQDKLNYILMALRYGNDPAWEGVYRPQCIRASLDPNGEYAAATGTKVKSFFSLWAWYQTYSERSLALHNLLPSTHAMSPSTHGGLALELFRYNDYRHSRSSKVSESDEGEDEEDPSEEKEVHQQHPLSSFFPSYAGVGGGDTGRVNVYRAMEFAGMHYASLEKRLASSQHGGHDEKNKQATYFLGTEKPTHIDALLFAHLAEALCDIHLVLVLSKHSLLMRYFQRLYDQFFGQGYEKAWKSNVSGQGSAESVDWIQRNNIANALNAFNQIPEATSTKQASKGVVSVNDDGHGMVHAIQLMQRMAVHCNELDEALRDAAALRSANGEEKAVLDSYHRPIGSRLYRWIMGGEVELWGSGQSKSSDAVVDNDGDNDEESHSGDEHEKEPSSSEEDSKKRMYQEHVKVMKRDRRTQDELWLSGVVLAVLTVLVVSASGKSK
mmetsp:Transcript_22868/g.49470  ORF Transcript_22868/g.49470 Transcript_22868/m.49470 type:complete len:717 (+) Transcript_22868:54-2204(+)